MSRLAGYRFAVIDLALKATADRTIALKTDSLVLVDLAGHEYGPLANGAGPAFVLPNSLGDGKTLAGKLTFEIPAGGNYSLRFMPPEFDILALVEVTRAIAAIDAVPDPTAKPRATTKPASATAGGGSGTGSAGTFAATANAYIESVLDLYGLTLPSWTLEMAFAEGCYTPGGTAEMCAATRDAWAPRVAEVKRLLSDHLNFTKTHPAATCFRDAYAADRALAQDYLAWTTEWLPMGTRLSSEARSQYIAWQDLDYRAEQLLDGMNGYFKDCR